MISLEEAALRQALELKKGTEVTTLRLYIEGKGCDGFYYGVSFDPKVEGDLSFNQELEGETLELIVDKDSYPFLKGASISWVDDERGRGFLVNNPDHGKYKGKFYRRKTFQMPTA